MGLNVVCRRGLCVLALLIGGLLITACGSSSSGSSSATAGTTTNASATSSVTTRSASGAVGAGAPRSAASGAFRAQATAFRTCLKQHGVTLPNRRPGAGRPGGSAPGTGGRFFHPGSGLRPNPKLASAVKACASKLPARRFAPSHTSINRYVACVRSHGYNMPNPNFKGGPIFPASIRTSTKFQAASRACLSQLMQHPPGSPPGG